MKNIFFSIIFLCLILILSVIVRMESSAEPDCKARVFRTANNVSYCQHEARKQKSIVKMKLKEKNGTMVTFISNKIRFHIDFEGELAKKVKRLRKGRWYTITFILGRENPDNSFLARGIAIK